MQVSVYFSCGEISKRDWGPKGHVVKFKNYFNMATSSEIHLETCKQESMIWIKRNTNVFVVQKNKTTHTHTPKQETTAPFLPTPEARGGAAVPAGRSDSARVSVGPESLTAPGPDSVELEQTIRRPHQLPDVLSLRTAFHKHPASAPELPVSSLWLHKRCWKKGVGTWFYKDGTLQWNVTQPICSKKKQQPTILTDSGSVPASVPVFSPESQSWG